MSELRRGPRSGAPQGEDDGLIAFTIHVAPTLPWGFRVLAETAEEARRGVIDHLTSVLYTAIAEATGEERPWDEVQGSEKEALRLGVEALLEELR